MGAISRVLTGYAAAQAAGLRDVAFGLILLAMAAGVVVLSLAFALAAGFWALSSVMPAWQAAAAMACVALILALVLRVVGVRMIRRRTRLAGSLVPAAALSSAVAQSRPATQASDTAMLLAMAAVAGLIIGRRLSR